MVGIIMYSEIQKRKKMGYKKQAVGRELGIDTKTVRKYWDMSEEEYAQYLLDSKERTKIVDPYRGYILERLQKYPEITSAVIYDNLREDFNDFSPSYRSVRLYVSNLRESEGIPSPLKIRQYGENPELPFGIQAQVDIGEKKLKDLYGKWIKVYIFAMVLSASRFKYICFQLEPFTAQTFIEAHDKAFKYFGGRPTEIVYDQDRVMVVSENAGDIIFTDVFDNYKSYAGFSVHLCRGSDPESKGKIEAVVKYVKNNFLACRTFHGIAKLNSDGLAWLDRTGNGLVHETTKMIPAVVFSEEQKHLKPVPELSSPLIPKIAIVRKNNIVVYKQNRYAMPIGTYYPGKNVRIETDEEAGLVSFFDVDDNSIIERHPLAQGIGKYIRNNHPERDKFSKYQHLKEKALQGFGEAEEAKEFLEKLIKAKPRYVRDQLGMIIKVQAIYSGEELHVALKYCISRELFSAVDFKDTLEYFQQEQGQEQENIKTHLPVKYSVVIAQTRPIEAYSSLYEGGDI